jgi:hypothetical protein
LVDLSWRRQAVTPVTGFKKKVLDCIIGRRLYYNTAFSSGLAKNVILKPLVLCPAALF